jgi:hypothetical protein
MNVPNEIRMHIAGFIPSIDIDPGISTDLHLDSINLINEMRSLGLDPLAIISNERERQQKIKNGAIFIEFIVKKDEQTIISAIDPQEAFMDNFHQWMDKRTYVPKIGEIIYAADGAIGFIGDGITKVMDRYDLSTERRDAIIKFYQCEWEQKNFHRSDDEYDYDYDSSSFNWKSSPSIIEMFNRPMHPIVDRPISEKDLVEKCISIFHKTNMLRTIPAGTLLQKRSDNDDIEIISFDHEIFLIEYSEALESNYEMNWVLCGNHTNSILNRNHIHVGFIDSDGNIELMFM